MDWRHHINGRKIDNANSLNNLCYLCFNCHREIHTGIIKKERIKSLNELVPKEFIEK